MKKSFIISLVITLSISSPALQAQSRFDRKSVVKILSSGNVRSVEDFLGTIYRSGQKKFFRNYVLMFNSRSIQAATFKDPRVIMFSKDDEFVMTFNGNNTQEGGKRMEMMQFNRKQRAFEFFDIDFDKPPSETVSDINPSRCLNCHRSDPRPNWDHYFFWSGMYGGDDDRLTRMTANLREALLQDKTLSNEKSSNFDLNQRPTLTEYREILESQKVQKYIERKLGNDFRQPTLTEYREVLESREGQEYIDFLLLKEGHPRYSYLEISYSTRSGLSLTNLLVNLNVIRIERKLKDDIEKVPFYFKYALLGTALCSPRIGWGIVYDDKNYLTEQYYNNKSDHALEGFLPRHILDSVRVKPIDYLNYYINIIKRDLDRRIHIHAATTGDDVSNMGRLSSDSPSIFPRLAPVKYVMTLAGLDNSDWSLSLSDRPIISGGKPPFIIRKNFVLSILGNEYKRDNTTNDLCEYLKSKSMELLESVSIDSNRLQRLWKTLNHETYLEKISSDSKK